VKKYFVNKFECKLPGIVLWLTGLSGSGKTTVSKGLFNLLEIDNISSILLDGDELRSKQNSYLGFSEKDIKRNNCIIAELCIKNRNDFNIIIVPIISPYRKSRSDAREIIGEGFYEIYFSASIDCVRKRDTKGLYAKSDRNEIKNLIGVAPTNPFEPPENADLIINTEKETITQSVTHLYNFVINLLNYKTVNHGKWNTVKNNILPNSTNTN
jgi:adenylylsulfate kinase